MSTADDSRVEGASLSPPSNIADDVTVSSPSNSRCEAERVLVQQSNRWTALFALCIGLEQTLDDGTKKPLLDANENPFCLLKKKDIKPSVDCLREEVKRRCVAQASNGTKIPKPNGWNAQKCVDWLKANPITSDEDVAFLLQKAEEVKNVVANATQKAPTQQGNQQGTDAESETGNKWFGPLPYLRLMHCLLEDDIKDKWIRRNRAKTIQEIDARRSDIRQPDVHEMIADRWNSKEFNPTTMVSNCHFHFSQEIDIGFQVTAEFARATPTKVKDKFAKMKTDLTSIIDKWERSGQGDGGVSHDVEEDDDYDEELEEQASKAGSEEDEGRAEPSRRDKFAWGRSEGRTGAFDSRDSFLGSNPSYLLYYWDILDQNGLFDTTINRMSDEAGASSANQVPNLVVVADGRSSHGTTNDDVSQFVSSFRDVLVEASKDAVVAADRRHEENKLDKERRHKEAIEAEDKRVQLKSNAAENRVILQARLENQGYLKRRIDSLHDEARKVRFKIFESTTKNDETEKKFYIDELELIEKAIMKCKDELATI